MGHADLNAGGKQMVIPATGSPTVPRMILGRQLETLRERAGLSHEQAAETILASAWTIRRIERAEVTVYVQVIDRLCALAAPADETQAILRDIRSQY
jgi:DNA-binding XRE family transcriptional regulator